DFNMDIQAICNMITNQFINRENRELFNPEDDARLRVLQNRITNTTVFDDDFKETFNIDMQCDFSTVAQNAFENGLNIGLRLLQTLLNVKLPDGMINNEPDITKQCKSPIQRHSGYNSTFIDFVEKASPYLSITQQLQLEGRIKCLLSENMERDIGISRTTNGGIV
ncbi:MAG: hypothetical protein K2F73_00090, partial [Ruminococcus sp.]|nr:hypothetical protein [Ruminococcus sp.]